LRGRNADNWRPLIAFADVVGGEWPAKARLAAVTLSAGLSEETAGIMVLDDIREMFEERGADKLFSEEMAKTLGDRDDRPWSEWKGDKPITQRQLARLLEPFDIKPKQVRIGAKSNKGYKLEDFADAFLRYPPVRSETSKQSKDSAGLRPVRSETRDTQCFRSKAPETAEKRHCFDVSDRDPLPSARAPSANPKEQANGQACPANLDLPGGLKAADVCDHCGAQGYRPDDPLQDCYIGADVYRLHRTCQLPWFQWDASR
jgi:putative DNA primase/helicase